jgi:hypothetical protein
MLMSYTSSNRSQYILSSICNDILLTVEISDALHPHTGHSIMKVMMLSAVA